MARGPAQQPLWPTRRYTPPRTAAHILRGCAFSLALTLLLISVGLAGVAYLLSRYPAIASSPLWATATHPLAVLRALLREPFAWMVIALGGLLGARLLAHFLAPRAEVVLYTDRLVARSEDQTQEFPYWQVERLTLEKKKQAIEGEATEREQVWLVIHASFERYLRLPLSGEQGMAMALRRALPELLARLPAWTRVDPAVQRWLQEHENV